MPLLQYSFTVPYPGFVVIHMNDMDFRFDEQSIRNAIEGLKRRKDTFETESDYRSILTIYEQALRLLEEEK